MPASPQGDQGMSWWSGFSTCSPPGEGDCVVWWDAWAAIFGGSTALVAVAALVVAWIGIGVTMASAFAVWRLGIAANGIAEGEARRTEAERTRALYRDETEALLVLTRIHTETTKNIDALSEAIDQLQGGGLGRALFDTDDNYRAAILDIIEGIGFPAATSVVDRLHYLDRSVSSSLIRAMSMIGYIQDVALGSAIRSRPGASKGAYASLMSALPKIVGDLKVVHSACRQAAERLRIKHPWPRATG